MNESKVICDYFTKTMSVRELKKREGIIVRDRPFWLLIIPLIFFYILILIFLYNESIWLSISMLILLAVYFSYIIRKKDIGKIFVIEDGVEYLLYDYKKKELLKYLTKERFLSSNITDNDRFYERLISNCKERSSIMSYSFTLSVFGILIILYDNALDELSWPFKIVLTLSMIALFIFLHLFRKIYYSSFEIGRFKRLLNVVNDLSLSNLRIKTSN